MHCSVDRRIRHAIETRRWKSGHRLAVVDLARCVNPSPSRFVHLSRRPTGHKPARSLRELKLNRARTLAEDSVLSIKEIMARAGFNDASHFACDFRRTYGISPHMAAARAIAKAAAPAAHVTGQANQQPQRSTSACNWPHPPTLLSEIRIPMRRRSLS